MERRNFRWDLFTRSVCIETTMRSGICISLLCLVVASSVVGGPMKKEANPHAVNWKHCDHICEDKVYSPVCAVDDSGVTRTFDHKCEVELAICLKSGYFAVIRDGVCL
ncbi:hypothetical protein L9F63_016778 [Diploptera punctata]|uniref:Kazal-like domain-containing protein n=1 Tax=Diploptera punctata TaxID=6984 RepID=A0AAD8EHG7_DIPPU|nr:hypothetical protein L9F63_016778 [Diploptera punctata]